MVILEVEIPSKMRRQLRNYAVQNGITLRQAATRFIGEGLQSWRESFAYRDYVGDQE
jgi:hypothetical protein